jgi:glycosyltransferase involved in cell wall biosynthesis
VTYNRAALLNGVIESILNQTLRDFELIIADDSSTDGTQELCQLWSQRDRRVRYRRQMKNVGMPRNLILGIEGFTGDYLAILHDDNVYSLMLLEKWSDLMDKYPNAGLVFNAYRILDANGHSERVFRVPLPECSSGAILLEEYYFRSWRFDSPIFGTVMMRRSTLDCLRVFDERYRFYADVDMWMRLAEEFDIGYIDEPLVELMCRDLSPRQFDDDLDRMQPILERMYWEARMRHYRGRPVRKLAEAIRHLGFLSAARGFNLALKIKHKLNL